MGWGVGGGVDLGWFSTGSGRWGRPQILHISSEDSDEDVDWNSSEFELMGNLRLCLGFFAKTVLVETTFSFMKLSFMKFGAVGLLLRALLVLTVDPEGPPTSRVRLIPGGTIFILVFTISTCQYSPQAC
jgi:hypothetical protein